MAEYTLKRPMWTADKTVYRAGTHEISEAHARELGLLKEEGGAALPHPGIGPAGDPLHGVDFASAAARELAESSGMVAADFEGATAAGASGFTKPEVQAFLDAQDAE